MTQQLLERRERILQTARDLIGELGYQNLTMRELAARCRVSVPTLYNQFGSKNELLATAVQSHFSGLLSAVPLGDRGVGHEKLIAIVRLRASEMTRLPSYHRKLLGAFMSSRDTTRTEFSITSGLIAELKSALAEMREREQLAEWLDEAVLAQQITGALVASAVAWALGVLDDNGLEATMLYAMCSLTLGATRGVARDALQQEAAAAQAILARKLVEKTPPLDTPATAAEA